MLVDYCFPKSYAFMHHQKNPIPSAHPHYFISERVHRIKTCNFTKAVIEAFMPCFMGKKESFMIKIKQAYIYPHYRQLLINSNKKDGSFLLTECLLQFFSDISIVQCKYMNEVTFSLIQGRCWTYSIAYLEMLHSWKLCCMRTWSLSLHRSNSSLRE